jgi:endonuclease/exonuclease/phosphatase family metal-dependent hydrolase
MKNFNYLLLVFISVSIFADTNIEAGEKLRVASFNIEHFGGTRKKPALQPTVKNLVKYILSSKASIIALQEIYQDGNYHNEKLDRLIRKLNDNNISLWKYKLFPNRSKNDKSQLVGILWDSHKVKMKLKPLKIPIRETEAKIPDHIIKKYWDRSPYAVKFQINGKIEGKNKSDFIIIPLHMKAMDNGAKQREFEITALIEDLEFIQEELNDKDIILIGDTNCKKNDKKTLDKLKKAGFTDLNNGLLMTTIDGYEVFVAGRRYPPAPFDRIFIQKKQPENQGIKMTVHKLEKNDKEHWKKFSDHFMIYTDLNVTADDD